MPDLIDVIIFITASGEADPLSSCWATGMKATAGDRVENIMLEKQPTSNQMTVPMENRNQPKNRIRPHIIADAIITSGRVINPLVEEIKSTEEITQHPRPVEDHGQHRDVPNPNTMPDLQDLEDGTIMDAPKLVDKLLVQAIDIHASDIHIEPQEGQCRVRFRVDGSLHNVGLIPEQLVLPALSRIKVLSDMDIAEKRRPQDARFRFPHDGRTVDIRVSTMPTGFGEKVVLRLLDQAALELELEELGFTPDGLAMFEQAITRPQGIVLVTGPTGSGKTTTLYAALKRIRDPKLNIVTIEDPIEYNLEGINQSQVKTDIGYTFANALRAFLRQDPNVIMVGEIRDAETAQIALRAAMTGHLVLSTVHTNDAATTMTRLLDLGAEPFMVASSLSLVLAQRLVRQLCTACRQPDSENAPGIFRAEGCSQCLGSGYRGRIGVFEVMAINALIRELIHNRAPAEHIRDVAQQEGLCKLHETAQAKLLAGVTTQEEIQREIGNPE